MIQKGPTYLVPYLVGTWGVRDMPRKRTQRRPAVACHRAGLAAFLGGGGRVERFLGGGGGRLGLTGFRARVLGFRA